MGKAAAVKATLLGAAANDPLLMLTLGVAARSCATTKYCTTVPVLTPAPPLSSE